VLIKNHWVDMINSGYVSSRNVTLTMTSLNIFFGYARTSVNSTVL